MTEHTSWCDGNGSTECWQCGGDGGFHDGGEDCCCCLDPYEITVECGTCDGFGFIRCPACEEFDAAYDFSDLARPHPAEEP